jgi:hypothetical protein
MKNSANLRLVLLCILLVTSGNFAWPEKAQAAAGINQQITFQGRVVNSDHTNVTNGTYDFVFKIYDGPGSAAATKFTETWSSAALFSQTITNSPPAAGSDGDITYGSNTNESTLKVGQILTNTTKGESVYITSINTATNTIGISATLQTWVNGDTVTNKVYVKNGIFRVNINSLNQDLSGVDFNSDSLFIGVNYNGDGEMKPRINLTTAAYAENAKTVGGVAGSVSSDGFTFSGGTSNSRQLTVTGADITIGNTITPTSAGALTMQSNGANSLTLTAGANSTWSSSAGALTITSNQAATWSTANGTLTLQGGGGTVAFGSTTTLSAPSATTLNLAANSVINPNASGTIGLGTSNATGITIGSSAVTTGIALTTGVTANTGLALTTGGLTNGGNAESITSTLSTTSNTNNANGLLLALTDNTTNGTTAGYKGIVETMTKGSAGTATGVKRGISLEWDNTSYTTNSSTDLIYGAIQQASANGFNLLRLQSGSSLSDVFKVTGAGAVTAAGAIQASNFSAGASVSGSNTGDQTLGGLGGVPTTTTVNGKALSGNITLSLASSDFANQGTTTTVLHGNASGNPSFGAIVNGDLTSGSYSNITGVGTLGSVTVSGSTSPVASITTTDATSGTDSVTITNVHLTPAAAATSDLLNLTFTDLSTNGAGTSIAAGLTLTAGSLSGVSGAGTHYEIGVNFPAIANTTCGAGTCKRFGLYFPSPNNYDDILNVGGTSVINASGQVAGSQVNGAVASATTATSATSATTATTATNANNVATTSVSNSASYFPLFVSSSSNGNQVVNLGTGLTFNPSTNNLSTTTFTGALSGNASTASALTPGRTINGTSFDGSANITVTAAAGTLTGATLNSGVTASSLTSVGTLTALTVSGSSNTELSVISTGTTGDVVTISDSVLAPAAAGTADTLAISFANTSTNTSGTSTAAGITITPSLNLNSSGGTHNTSGINFVALGTNTCTGGATCNKYGIYFPSSTNYTDLISYNGTSILSSAGNLNAAQLTGTIPSTVLGNSSVFIGTTSVALNRGTGSLALTGITSIDGSAASATTATTATNANNVATTSVSNSASYFPLFVSSSSNGNQAVNLGTGLTFNPSTNNLSTTTFTGALSGNSSTASALSPGRTINGTAFDGTGNITVTAAAGTLTGTTLNSTVVTSSLTSVGTLTGLTVTSTATSGNASAFTDTSFAHTASDTHNLGTFVFTDATSANTASIASFTNGINITSTVNVTGGASSSGLKTISALNVTAPTFTACSGGSNTCAWNGISISPTTGITNLTETAINIAAITASANTENAISIGTGWDMGIIDSSTVDIGNTNTFAVPSSVGTTPGTNAPTAFIAKGGAGGNTTIATTGTGGIGGIISITTGAGGQATAATTAATGGAGGLFTLASGAGGVSSVAGAGTNTGGAGGAISITAGNGGNATTGAGTLTGGAGGAINLTAGNAGTGGNAAGGNIGLTAGTGTGTGNPGTITLTSSVATGATTSSAYILSAASLTTGTGVYFAPASLTQGNGVNLVANALTSGTGINVNSSSTAFTGTLVGLTLSGSNAANTGALLSLTNSGALNHNDVLLISNTATDTTSAAIDITGAGNRTINSTSGNLTIQTTTSGTLALTSAGALTLTGNAASTWDLGAAHTLSIQTTNNGAITTGTGLFTSGGSITFGGTTARVITGPTTGGLTITDDQGNLTLSTTTSGTLALNSAGVLNMTAASNTSGVTIDTNTTFDVDTTNHRIGIGAVPGSVKLDVRDSSTSNYVMRIMNTAVSAGTKGLVIDLGVANASRTTSSRFIDFASSGTVAGKIQGGVSAVAYTTTLADYAEYFRDADVTSQAQSGEIVSFGSDSQSAQKSSFANDQTALGIVSTQPGFIGNGPLCRVDDDNCDSNYGKVNTLVAMNGQVPLKVSNENGPIKIGDFLTTSSSPGVAMKATKAGQMIARAEENYSGSGTATIHVLVYNGFADPTNTLSNLTLDKNGNLEVPKLTADQIYIDGKALGLPPESPPKVSLISQIAQLIQRVSSLEAAITNLQSKNNSTQQPQSNTADVGEITVTGGKIVIQNGNKQSVVSIDSSGDATFSGTLTAKSIKADQIEGLSDMTKKLVADTLAAQPTASPTIAPTPAPTAAPTPSANPSPSSVPTSPAVVADTLNQLLANGALTFQGPTEFRDKTFFDKIAEFFDNTIFHGDIAFLGRPSFNSDTAGFAVIKQDDEMVTITFDKEYAQIPVVNASITLDNQPHSATPSADLALNPIGSDDAVLLSKVSYVITNRSTKGFTIKLNQLAPVDVTFSWTALSVNSPKTTYSTAFAPQPSVTPSIIVPSAAPTPVPSIIYFTTPTPTPFR